MRKLPIPFPLVENIDDHKMVELLLQKAEEETDQFLYGKEHGTFLSFYMYYYTTGCNNVVDFTQTIYLHIITKKKDKPAPLECFPKKLHRWLYKVCRNYCITEYRKHRNVKFCPSENLLKELEDETSVVIEIDYSFISSILNMMPTERYRKILQYRYENLKPKEIAEIMGVKRAKIYKDTFNANVEFRSILKQNNPKMYEKIKKWIIMEEDF